MRYMLLIYVDERSQAGLTPQDREAASREWWALTEDMKKAGAWRAGDPLQPVRTATTVRVRGGKPLTTDGPFAETKEQLGGYYLLDVPDLDAALGWAARCPNARTASVEVRPIMDFVPR